MSVFTRFLKLGRYGALNSMQSRLVSVAISRRFLTVSSTISPPFLPSSRRIISETRTFSTGKVPASTKIPTPEPTIGYELVLDRSVKIMVNVTERAMTSVLHTYCDARLIEYLGTNTNFDIIGCSDRQAEVDSVQEFKQYSQIDLVSYSLVSNIIVYDTKHLLHPSFTIFCLPVLALSTQTIPIRHQRRSSCWSQSPPQSTHGHPVRDTKSLVGQWLCVDRSR